MPSEALRGTEVALRRLLQASEAQRSDADWCASPQARHAVDTAQQYANELSAAGAPAAALADYRSRTEALSAALRTTPRPAYLRAPVSRAATGELPRALPLPAGDVGARGADPGAPALRRRVAPPSADTAATLRRHAALQEDLTDELVDMAASLKRNALALETGLRDSLRVLNAVEGAVEHNVGAASRAAKRAEELHAVNRASCWHTCVVLTVVLVVFCWMVVLIRTSRDRLRPRL